MLTVDLLGEDGSGVLKRQVSTKWEKVRAFFADLAEKARPEGGFLAILEVCGMNPWLLTMLREYGCREIVVIQPTERSKQKTDRRDARKLSPLLWVHRQQFLEGKHPIGVRRVHPEFSPVAVIVHAARLETVVDRVERFVARHERRGRRGEQGQVH
jgi:hypothetical protein